MKTFIIPQDQDAGIGSIASQHYDRDIVFAKDCVFAVVLSSYYGGKGYTTHKTAEAALKKCMELKDYCFDVIDSEGEFYGPTPDGLEKDRS